MKKLKYLLCLFSLLACYSKPAGIPERVKPEADGSAARILDITIQSVQGNQVEMDLDILALGAEGNVESFTLEDVIPFEDDFSKITPTSIEKITPPTENSEVQSVLILVNETHKQWYWHIPLLNYFLEFAEESENFRVALVGFAGEKRRFAGEENANPFEASYEEKIALLTEISYMDRAIIEGVDSLELTLDWALDKLQEFAPSEKRQLVFLEGSTSEDVYLDQLYNFSPIINKAKALNAKVNYFGGDLGLLPLTTATNGFFQLEDTAFPNRLEDILLGTIPFYRVSATYTKKSSGPIYTGYYFFITTSLANDDSYLFPIGFIIP